MQYMTYLKHNVCGLVGAKEVFQGHREHCRADSHITFELGRSWDAGTGLYECLTMRLCVQHRHTTGCAVPLQRTMLRHQQAHPSSVKQCKRKHS